MILVSQLLLNLGKNFIKHDSSEQNHLMNEILLHCENISKEIDALTEITKNYKNLLSSIENYSGAKNNNDFPLCIKKLSDIESNTIKITDYFKKLTKSEYVQLEKLNEILDYVQKEKSKSNLLEKEIIRNVGLNLENDFMENGMEIKGDLDGGIKAKNFLLHYDKQNFKIIIYYLFQKEKFVKIDGLNNTKAVEMIKNFYQKTDFQKESLEKTLVKIFSIYSNLSEINNSSKIRILDIMDKFYDPENSQKKSMSEKRIEFSFILYKIESSMMKTNDDKSMKLGWATGENIIDKKKQIDIPNSEQTTTSKNISFVEFH